MIEYLHEYILNDCNQTSHALLSLPAGKGFVCLLSFSTELTIFSKEETVNSLSLWVPGMIIPLRVFLVYNKIVFILHFLNPFSSDALGNKKVAALRGTG